MNHTHVLCRAAAILLVLFGIAFHISAAETIRSELVAVTVNQGRYAIQSQGQAVPFATGALRYKGAIKVIPVDDPMFGKGQAITVTAADGSAERFQVFVQLPFAVYQATLVQHRRCRHGGEQGAA